MEEVKFCLDKDVVFVEVYVKECKEVYMMIEDFMLLANWEVVQFISLKGWDQEIFYVYCIYDEFDLDKVMEFFCFVCEMGFDMNISFLEQVVKVYNCLVQEV